MKKVLFPGYMSALGCLIVLFIDLGMVSSIGLFLPEIVKELRVSLSEASLIITFSCVTAFISSFFAGRFIKKNSAKWMLLIASFISALHFYIFGLSTTLWMLYIGGILGGLGMGFGANVCAASIISDWFIDKRHVVIGTVFGGATFGSAVIMIIAGRLIVANGWRNAYFILAAAGLIIAVCANLLLIRNPKKKGIKPLGWKPNEAKEIIEESESNLKIWKTPFFWLLLIGCILVGQLTTGFQSFAPSFWQANGLSTVESSNYMSLFVMAGAKATIVSGIIAEKFGYRIYILFIILNFIIGMVLVIIWASILSVFVIVISVIVIAMSYPSASTIPPIITTHTCGVFGSKNYTKVTTYLIAGIFMGKSTASPLMGLVTSFSKSIVSYYIVLIAFAVTALILILIGIGIAHKKINQKCDKEEINTNETIKIMTTGGI